jgi:hypothetical protein
MGPDNLSGDQFKGKHRPKTSAYGVTTSGRPIEVSTSRATPVKVTYKGKHAAKRGLGSGPNFDEWSKSHPGYN